MRIIYVTTIGITMGFFKSFISELIEEGHTVDIATNDTNSPIPECYKKWGCKSFTLCTSRSPFSRDNLKAIYQIRDIVEKGKYDIVHCHTPLASICTRLACRKMRKNGIRVIYTAHGFHFFKGAPIINWILYYPMEKLCSHWTDILVTINQEDYKLALKHMKAQKVFYVPGVGIDLHKFCRDDISKAEVSAKRKELGVKENERMILSVGELIKRKNHESVILALSRMKEKEWKYFICGAGPLENHLIDVIEKNGLQGRVFLLGFRRDINVLCASSDLFVFPSVQEGLPVALMEAMAMNTFSLSSQIRGSEELLNKEDMFSPTSIDDIEKHIRDYYFRKDIRERIEANYERLKSFDIATVNKKMKEIYGIRG